MRIVIAASAILSAVVLTFPAHAADPKLGAGIAQSRCGKCHATGPKGESPARAAPPFRDLAREPLDMLEAARHSGVVAGHDEMPMFDVTRAEADALIAYIRNLAPKPKR